MIASLLFVLLQAAPAIPADLVVEFKSIKAEQSAIETENNDLTLAQATLKKNEDHIVDTEALRDRGIATFISDRDVLATEIDAQIAAGKLQAAEARAVAEMVANYNGRCTGTFEQPQYDACNAERIALLQKVADVDAWAKKINAWAIRLKTKSDALQKQKETLEEIMRGIEADRGTLSARTDSLDKRNQKLESRRTKLDERRNKALERLAKTDAISQDCAEIAKKITADSCKGVGDPSDPANWNTPCEQAARCLQKAWDGAR